MAFMATLMAAGSAARVAAAQVRIIAKPRLARQPKEHFVWFMLGGWWSSFRSQHDHRIGPGGTESGDQAGGSSDSKQQRGVAGEDEWVVCGDAEQ